MAMCCSLSFDNLVRLQCPHTANQSWCVCQCCNARVSPAGVLWPLLSLKLCCQYYVIAVATAAHNLLFVVEIMKRILTCFEDGLTTR